MAGSIYGSIQSGSGSTNSFTPTLPNSGGRYSQATLLLIISTEDSSSTAATVALSGTDSANWTQLTPTAVGSSSANRAGLWFYARITDGTEGAPTVTLQSSATTQYTWSCMEVHGLATTIGGLVDATNTWAAITSSTANTNQVSPSKTFSSRWIAMAIGGRASSPTGTWTGPTQAINVTNGSSCYQIVGTQDATSSATYQPKVVLSLNTLSNAIAITFNLGSGGSTPEVSANGNFLAFM